MTDRKPWTTELGEILQEMYAGNAPPQHTQRLEDELTHAFSCIKFVRRCYHQPSQHLAEHE